MWSLAISTFAGSEEVWVPRLCQVALKVPAPKGTPKPLKDWHVDRFKQENKAKVFALLVAMALNDTSAAGAQRGGLAVWRGQHEEILSFLQRGGNPRDARTEADIEAAGEQLRLNAGGVVFAHHKYPVTLPKALAAKCALIYIFGSENAH